MFYYLTVHYSTPDMCLSSLSNLRGPYKTRKARQAEIDKDMKDRDLECEEEINVTLLEVRNGKLKRTDSFIPDFEDYMDDDSEVD